MFGVDGCYAFGGNGTPGLVDCVFGDGGGVALVADAEGEEVDEDPGEDDGEAT